LGTVSEVIFLRDFDKYGIDGSYDTSGYSGHDSGSTRLDGRYIQTTSTPKRYIVNLTFEVLAIEADQQPIDRECLNYFYLNKMMLFRLEMNYRSASIKSNFKRCPTLSVIIKQVPKLGYIRRS